MNDIEPPDTHHLSAAVGWIGLGDWTEANEEIKKISPASRAHPSVLVVEYEICAQAQRWNRAAAIARSLCEADPKDAQFWIWHAYATRRMPGGGIPLAREILTKAQQLLPEEPLVCYNLGCYECQLGNLHSARQWLEKAFAKENRQQFKTLALADSDLQPLWAELKEI